VVVEPEQQVWTGSSYLSPLERLSRDADGTYHVNTRYRCGQGSKVDHISAQTAGES
jgi:hypothetical protein